MRKFLFLAGVLSLTLILAGCISIGMQHDSGEKIAGAIYLKTELIQNDFTTVDNLPPTEDIKFATQTAVEAMRKLLTDAKIPLVKDEEREKAKYHLLLSIFYSPSPIQYAARYGGILSAPIYPTMAMKITINHANGKQVFSFRQSKIFPYFRNLGSFIEEFTNWMGEAVVERVRK